MAAHSVLFDAWRRLGPYTPKRIRRSLMVAGMSATAGFLEASVLVIIVAVAVSLADGASAVSVGLPFLGDLESSQGSLILVAFGAACALMAIHLLTPVIATKMSSDVLEAMRNRAAEAFAEASWERQSLDREGSLQETISSLAIRSAYMALLITHGAAAVLNLSAILIAACIVNAGVAAVVAVLALLLFFGLRPLSRRTRSRSSAFVTGNSEFNESVSQTVSMAMEYRAFGVSEAATAELRASNNLVTEAYRKTRLYAAIGATIYKDLAIVFIVLAVGSLLLLESIDLAAVGAIVLLVVRSVSYAQEVQSLIQSSNEFAPNVQAFEERVNSLAKTAEHVGDEDLDAFAAVEVRGVGYTYPEEREPALSAIDLRIELGEVVGIVGPSGGGKSTLAQLLVRLRRPKVGQILVGGVPHEDIAAHAWARSVAFVPQEPRLFAGSVEQNIAFHRPQITRAMVEHAAELAHVADDIRALPAGFDTILQSRGTGLSGGQKQRVAIARALVGQPWMLVLDEPTSALDMQSERLIEKTLQELRGQVTVVIVAHRLTTLRACDRIVVVEDGRITAEGPQETLPDVSEFFRSARSMSEMAEPPSASTSEKL